MTITGAGPHRTLNVFVVASTIFHPKPSLAVLITLKSDISLTVPYNRPIPRQPVLTRTLRRRPSNGAIAERIQVVNRLALSRSGKNSLKTRTVELSASILLTEVSHSDSFRFSRGTFPTCRDGNEREPRAEKGPIPCTATQQPL